MGFNECLKILNVNILLTATRELNHGDLSGPDTFSHCPDGKPKPLGGISPNIFQYEYQKKSCYFTQMLVVDKLIEEAFSD